MAESFSIKAILSAADKGFTATMKSASGYVDNLKSTLTSGIGFGVMMAAGQKAFDVINNGVTGLIGGMNEAGAAWKTFQGNMEMNGHAAAEIKSIKGELQDFAEATIYSSSDMASTFAQLEAVGTKNTKKLVKGFGGLAAAAENPAQAMKTLSQQATQMAAKPKVAWEDFKLMLEQTPAGISAVAKQMGKSTQSLIKDVQAGKLATEDFFDAIATVGTNDAFTKLATEYKTVDQAMDGLQETMSNKLQPAFEVLSSKGISAISKLVDKTGELDGEKIAAKLTSGLDKVKPYWDVLVSTASEVGSAFGDAFSAISGELADLNGEFGSTESVEGFGDAIGVAGDALKTFAGFLEDNADTVAMLIDNLPKLLVAYMAFKTVKAVAPGVVSFGRAIMGLTGSGISGLATKLFGVRDATKTVGEASASSGKQVLQSAVSFMAFGAAVLIAGAGMYVLSAASINLVNAGTPAIAVMAGMVVAMAGLMALSAVLGPALTAGAVGFIAFGAAIVLVASGALIASAALAVVAAVLPTVSEYGTQGAVSIAALGASMIVFAAGAAAAGAGCIALGAGLMVVAVGLVAVGAAIVVVSAGVLTLAAGATLLGAGLTLVAASLTVAGASLPLVASGALASAAAFTVLLTSATALSVIMLANTAAFSAFGIAAVASTAGIIAFGVGMTAACVGVLAMSVALKPVNSSMKSISKNASSAKKSISSMRKSLDIVNDGLDALGSKAKSAINSFISAFSNAESKAKTAGRNIGNNINNGVKSGLDKLPSTARNSMDKFNSGITAGGIQATASAKSISLSITSTLRATGNSAYSSGQYIGQGLANGMRSTLGTVRSVAAQLASAADAAIRAKAKIHSPSRVSEKDGAFWGEGWVGGILSKVKDAKKATQKLISIPRVRTPEIALAAVGGVSLNDDYTYGSKEITYTIYVPVEVDGRQIAKASAVYTQEELEKLDKQNKRKHGIK